MKRLFLTAILVVIASRHGMSQAPLMDGVVYKRTINTADCVRIGKAVFSDSGYRNGATGDDSVKGFRDVTSAYWKCIEGPNGATEIHLTVAVNGKDDIAQSELKVLQTKFENIPVSSYTGGLNPQWVSHAYPFPRNTVYGGTEKDGNSQAVCRVLRRGDYVPGKVISSTCDIAVGDDEKQEFDFDILTGNYSENFWGAPNLNVSKFYTGSERGLGERSCRARLNVDGDYKGVHIGKEAGAACIIPYKGITHVVERGYDVLYSVPVR